MGDQNFSTTPTLACGIYRMPSNHFNAAAQSANTATLTTTFTIRFVICQLLTMAIATAACDCRQDTDTFEADLQARQSFQHAPRGWGTTIVGPRSLENPSGLRTASGPHDQHGTWRVPHHIRRRVAV